jgi:hypothetical protein
MDEIEGADVPEVLPRFYEEHQPVLQFFFHFHSILGFGAWPRTFDVKVRFKSEHPAYHSNRGGTRGGPISIYA